MTHDDAPAPSLEEQLKALMRDKFELQARLTEAQYQIGGLQDVARMNTAASILAGYVARNNQMSRAMMVEAAVEMADALVSYYSDIIEKNAAVYRERTEELEQSLNGEETEQ